MLIHAKSCIVAKVSAIQAVYELSACSDNGVIVGSREYPTLEAGGPYIFRIAPWWPYQPELRPPSPQISRGLNIQPTFLHGILESSGQTKPFVPPRESNID